MAAASLKIIVHPDAERFLARAEQWLSDREDRYNLLLGIARQLVEDAPYAEHRPLLATVERAGAVAGCVFRTPPHKLGLTEMPLNAVPQVVRMVADRYDQIPAVLGPESVAAAFARRWSKVRCVYPAVGMRQRIYRLSQLSPHARNAQGRMRTAEPGDLAILSQWIASFSEETGTATRRAEEMTALLIDHEALVVWDDDGPASMAGTQGFTPRGVRISYVYTPPARRGRGYATSLVHALSHRMLGEGRDFCVLYTDLANTTSNAMYRRLGYEPVQDVVDYNFGPVT